jgi:hypothetical protein
MFGRIALLTISSIAAAAWQTSASAQQFSAEMTRPAPGKIYVADGKIRMETTDTDNGLTITIADGKTLGTYMLLPSEKIYVDVTQQTYVAQSLFVADPNNACAQWRELWQKLVDDAEHWTCKRVAEETVGGRRTIKYEIIRPDGERSYEWIDPKLKFVITSQGTTPDEGIEVKNIEEGPQAASFFEVPADYRMMDINEWLQRDVPTDWGDDQ